MGGISSAGKMLFEVEGVTEALAREAFALAAAKFPVKQYLLRGKNVMKATELRVKELGELETSCIFTKRAI